MDRKHLFKHKTATAKSAREKRRHERQEAQRKNRDEMLIGKRLRRNTVSEGDDFTEEQIVELTKKLMADLAGNGSSMKTLRRALSLGTALIDAFLSVEGSLKWLVGVMEDSSQGNHQVEAAWCLNNISAGTNSQATIVIETAGAAVVKGLTSGNVPLEDQCAWTVGNLAGGNAECRQSLRELGAIDPLIGLLKSPIPSVVHCAAFALSNLARDKETTNLLTDAGILPELVSHLVYEKGRLDILTEVCWVLTYLTACGTHEKEVIAAGVLDKTISLVVEVVDKDMENILVLTPLLRCLGNIICSGLEQSGGEACQRKELFPALERLLHSDHQHVRKECLWVLSNISALDAACKEDYMNTTLVTSVAGLLSATFDVKKEAIYTLCNIAAHGAECAQRLMSAGALQQAVPLLKSSDAETVHYALSFCEMMLQHCTADAVKIFQECGGMEGLEGLEYNENDALRAQADNILEVYFYKEDKTDEKVDKQLEEVPLVAPAEEEKV